MIDDAELVPLSALQHYLYCPRQCALIHVERQWAENRATAEGAVLHQRVDRVARRSRQGLRTVTAMPLRCERLGLVGVADVVEIAEEAGLRRVNPVEYKRGRPKRHRADEVQLCAQALCLEEMFDLEVPTGELYYGKQRRRKAVSFDAELRALTEQTAAATRRMILDCVTPAPDYSPRLCGACSLAEICQPQRLSRRGSVRKWLRRQVED